MRIAVTALGDTPEAMLDDRFGRAAKILVINTDDGSYEVVDNSAGVSAAQGAGIQTAEKIAGLAVDALITAHCGPKAFTVLKRAGVRVYSSPPGTVAEALLGYEKGSLPALDGADVSTHW